jgi:anti-anti-sigma regulatory factor
MTFIDSSGIRALLALAERSEGRGFVIRHPTENVQKVFDLTGIIGRWGIKVDEK